MPIYDYSCTACGHVTEVVHGINEAGPRFCPDCGTEGSMRKALSPPTIVFKGSGWAKVDRRSSSTRSSSSGSKPKAESTSSSGAEGSSSSASSASESGGSGKAGTSSAGGGAGGTTGDD